MPVLRPHRQGLPQTDGTPGTSERCGSVTTASATSQGFSPRPSMQSRKRSRWAAWPLSGKMKAGGFTGLAGLLEGGGHRLVVGFDPSLQRLARLLEPVRLAERLVGQPPLPELDIMIDGPSKRAGR